MFGFAVTSEGGGIEVSGREYKEYRIGDYSPWLRDRIRDERYWNTIRGCILGSKACDKIESWTVFDYIHRDLTPIQVCFYMMLT